MSRRERCWGCIFVCENSPEKLPHVSLKSCHNLMVQGTAQLEHGSHIVKVGVEATW